MLALRVHGGSRDHAAAAAQCLRQCRIASFRPGVDQQHVHRDCLGTKACNGFDNPGKLRAGNGIATGLPHRFIVDRNDGDRIGRRPPAAHECAEVGYGRFNPLNEPHVAAPVRGTKAGSPKTCQRERNQCLERPSVHPLLFAETGQQRGNTFSGPAADSQGTLACFHVHSLARPKEDSGFRLRPAHRNAPPDNKY